jgi:preprotein translocase SecE subunit
MDFKYYKPGQGTWARWTAGILLGLLVLFGAHSLYTFPDRIHDDGTKTFWGKVLSGEGTSLEINMGLIISVLVFALGCVGVYLVVVNGRRPADFLIDTEAEMHKVSWPPRHEWVGSSIVVMVSVVIIGGFVALVDRLLAVLLYQSGLL